MAAAKPKEENPEDLKGQNGQSGSTETLPTVRALCLTNVKHNQDYYRAGDKLDLPQDVFHVLMAAKAIRPLGE